MFNQDNRNDPAVLRAAEGQSRDVGPAREGAGGPLVLAVAGSTLAALYVFYLNDVPDCQYDQEHDMFFYMGFSRNLIDGQYPTKHWMPGFPVILAGLMRWFGANWAALKSSMIVIAALGMVLSRWFFRTVLPRSASTPLAIVLASTPIVFNYSHRLMSEVPAMIFTLLALLAMTKVAEPEGRRIRWAWALALSAGGVIAVLVRGNALAIIPALFVGILRLRKPSERAMRMTFGCAVVAILAAFAAWSIRSERRQYVGIHNVTYAQEIQAKDIGALWASSGKFGDGVERVDASSLVRRVYMNFAWYQSYRIAGLMVPSGINLDNVKSSGLGFALVIVLLVPHLIGFRRLARLSPELATFLLFSMLLIVVYPTGGSPRMLLPTIPLLLMTGYLGLEHLVGPGRVIGWLMCVIAANLATCAIEGDKQKFHPYSREGFQDFVELVTKDLPKACQAGEVVGTGFPVEVFALTGLQAQEGEPTRQAVAEGKVASALFVMKGPVAAIPGVEAIALAERGQTRLLRITRAGSIRDRGPKP